MTGVCTTRREFPSGLTAAGVGVAQTNGRSTTVVPLPSSPTGTRAATCATCWGRGIERDIGFITVRSTVTVTGTSRKSVSAGDRTFSMACTPNPGIGVVFAVTVACSVGMVNWVDGSAGIVIIARCSAQHSGGVNATIVSAATPIATRHAIHQSCIDIIVSFLVILVVCPVYEYGGGNVTGSKMRDVPNTGRDTSRLRLAVENRQKSAGDICP